MFIVDDICSAIALSILNHGRNSLIKTIIGSDEERKLIELIRNSERSSLSQLFGTSETKKFLKSIRTTEKDFLIAYIYQMS